MSADQLVAVNGQSVFSGVDRLMDQSDLTKMLIPDAGAYGGELASDLQGDGGLLDARPSPKGDTCAQFAQAMPPPPTLDVKKVIAAARQLLVEGVHTAKNGASGYLPHVDRISQVLKVKINRPATSEYPEDEAIMSVTCGRRWSCAAAEFNLCPGMQMNTFEVASPAPAFEWDAKPDMKYTLLFIVLFSPAWASLFAQMGATIPQGYTPPDSNHHWSVYNMARRS